MLKCIHVCEFWDGVFWKTQGLYTGDWINGDDIEKGAVIQKINSTFDMLSLKCLWYKVRQGRQTDNSMYKSDN